MTNDNPAAWPKESISAADTAKLVRAALKKAFPGIKFSVRSDTYSMGASIDVKWTDGPTKPMVEKVSGQFSGSNFDGMIDLKNSFSSWLLPDGSAIVAHDSGTEGSAGTIGKRQNAKPHPDARLVHFRADYVHCHRSLSPAFCERVLARMRAKWGVEVFASVAIKTYEYDGSGHFETSDMEAERLLREEANRFIMVRAAVANAAPAPAVSGKVLPFPPRARAVGAAVTPLVEGRTIPSEVLSILGYCQTEANRLKLPRLNRSDYLAVAEVLNAAGLKWNKQAQAMIGENGTDAADIIDGLLATGKVYRPEDYGCFDTPDDVARVIVALSIIEPGMRVLEPSAGTGQLVKPLLQLGATVDAIELLPDRAATLRAILPVPAKSSPDAMPISALYVQQADFLAMEPPTREGFKFDRVIMNPPFAKRADLMHVTHALKFLKPCGHLTAIMSAGVKFRQDRATTAFREMVAARGGEIEDLPPDSFKAAGTGVNAVIVTIPGRA